MNTNTSKNLKNNAISSVRKVNEVKAVSYNHQYLFIGRRAMPDSSLNLDAGTDSHWVDDFLGAFSVVERVLANRIPMPDAIVMDIPVELQDLNGFVSFLRDTPRFSAIPILYNSRQLKEDQIEDLRKQQLIDEVMDMQEWGKVLDHKVAFLKKVKQHPPLPHLEREEKVVFVEDKLTVGKMVKRGMDIVLSLILLAIAAPVMLLVAIAIKFDSKGPIFYTSKRAGTGYRIFDFFKFRSMAVNADAQINQLSHLNQYGENANGSKFFKLNNDPRVTRVGRILRKTSLDELPQIINVLKGDMSLVGNRPLPLYEAETLTTNESIERFMAPAGITGLWQITKRGNPTMSEEERINLDISYSRKTSLFLDLMIMVKTPAALLQKSDA